MKRRYEIKNDSVTEFENEIYNGNWSFQILKKDTMPTLFSFMGVADSFDRAKKWLLENHPEMFLWKEDMKLMAMWFAKFQIQISKDLKQKFIGPLMN